MQTNVAFSVGEETRRRRRRSRGILFRIGIRRALRLQLFGHLRWRKHRTRTWKRVPLIEWYGPWLMNDVVVPLYISLVDMKVQNS